MSRARALVLPGAILCLSLAVIAADQPAGGTGSGEAVMLFDGKDLSGWTWVPKDGDSKIEDVWSVVDGNLRCKGKPTGYIRTDKDYTSYNLKLQLRHLEKGNGGVLLRVVGPDKVWPKSIEAQGQAGALGDIWNIGNVKMKVAEERTKGRNTKRAKPEVDERPVGEWNDYEIILDGPNLTLKVNGVVQNEATEVEVVAGKIALQSEGAPYEFRNIVLTPIKTNK
jgi:hypothetical protein